MALLWEDAPGSAIDTYVVNEWRYLWCTKKHIYIIIFQLKWKDKEVPGAYTGTLKCFTFKHLKNIAQLIISFPHIFHQWHWVTVKEVIPLNNVFICGNATTRKRLISCEMNGNLHQMFLPQCCSSLWSPVCVTDAMPLDILLSTIARKREGMCDQEAVL